MSGKRLSYIFCILAPNYHPENLIFMPLFHCLQEYHLSLLCFLNANNACLFLLIFLSFVQLQFYTNIAWQSCVLLQPWLLLATVMSTPWEFSNTVTSIQQLLTFTLYHNYWYAFCFAYYRLLEYEIRLKWLG